MASPPPTGPSPVEGVRLVERFEQERPGGVFQATSLPGHLIHLVINGEVEQACNGRRYHLRPGSIVWYHEDEWVEGRVVTGPWIWYSVNFAAPTLSPPPFDARLLDDAAALVVHFENLWNAWHGQPSSQSRDCLCQSHLLSLIAGIGARLGSTQPSIAPTGKLWWEVETWARQRIDTVYSLSELASVFKRTPNTLARACHEAVGLPPMKRLKQIRLNLARGLVHHSDLDMTRIALRVGYPRVHEFSRDYHKAYGCAPTTDRRERQASR